MNVRKIGIPLSRSNHAMSLGDLSSQAPRIRFWIRHNILLHWVRLWMAQNEG